MATQKPISTISYNTVPFLREKLDGLIRSHTIQAYQFICHKGEDGDKDHIHLRVEPNKRIDQMDLTELFKEFEVGKDKPLGVRTWRASKEEDWFLYAVHDEAYLKLKYGGAQDKEKLPYDWRDIQTDDGYLLEEAFLRAKASISHTAPSIISRLQNGSASSQLIMEGENPFLVSQCYRAIYQDDYASVVVQLKTVQARLDAIMRALDQGGYSILANDDGSLRIVATYKELRSFPIVPDEEGFSNEQN